jgi:hypothetical protein
MRFAAGRSKRCGDHVFVGSHASWFGQLEKKLATIIRTISMLLTMV